MEIVFVDAVAEEDVKKNQNDYIKRRVGFVENVLTEVFTDGCC